MKIHLISPLALDAPTKLLLSATKMPNKFEQNYRKSCIFIQISYTLCKCMHKSFHNSKFSVLQRSLYGLSQGNFEHEIARIPQVSAEYT